MGKYLKKAKKNLARRLADFENRDKNSPGPVSAKIVHAMNKPGSMKISK